MDAVLKHLDACLIPPTFGPTGVEIQSFSESLIRGSTALGILGTIMPQLPTNPSSKDLLIGLVADRLHDICAWIGHCFHWVNQLKEAAAAMSMTNFPRASHVMHASTLRTLIEADEVILEALCSLPIFFDTILQFWTPGWHGDVIMADDSLVTCPVLGLLQHVVDHEVGLETFVQTVLARGSAFTTLVVRGFMERISEIMQMTGGSKMAVLRFTDLLLFSQRLSSASQFLHFALTKHGFFTRCMHTFNSISTYLVNTSDPPSAENTQTLVHLTHGFLDHHLLSASRSMYNCRDVIAGGAFAHIARLATIVPLKDKQSVRYILQCLELVGSHVPYPSVLKRFEDTMVPKDWASALAGNPIIAPLARKFLTSLQEIRGLYSSARDNLIVLCDNPFVSIPNDGISFNQG